MSLKPDTSKFSLFDILIRRLGRHLLFFVILLLANFLLPILGLSPRGYYIADKIADILLTMAVAAILIGLVRVGQDYVIHRFDTSQQDNLRARKVRTQLQYVRKVLVTIIVVVTICVILLSFENLRKVGSGLLAGVGVGGIIIGFAAQRSLSNLLAGFQIAFTQPLRIDDVLIVEGEFGRVEEITLTYVVLRLWDQRRLILPINYFIEKPFQNWTRTTTELLGTVEFYVDYTMPIEAIRQEFDRLINATPLWDKRAAVIQVTDARENTIQVRALVSASNAGIAFDLRCYIRENLIAFIQKNYPECLPKQRGEYRLKYAVAAGGSPQTENPAP